MNLRLSVRIPLAGFADLLEIRLHVLQAREMGRAPWTEEEIARVKERVAAHLSAGANALRVLS